MARQRTWFSWAPTHAANGDVANKIGTYGWLYWHGSTNSLYVAAPVSTIDLNLASGEEIPVEEREPEEVTHLAGLPWHLPGSVSGTLPLTLHPTAW